MPEGKLNKHERHEIDEQVGQLVKSCARGIQHLEQKIKADTASSSAEAVAHMHGVVCSFSSPPDLSRHTGIQSSIRTWTKVAHAPWKFVVDESCRVQTLLSCCKVVQACSILTC